MALKQVLESIDLLSPAGVTGADVAEVLTSRGAVDVRVEHVDGEHASTDFLSCVLPGSEPGAPTLGIVGRLGGLGARPEAIGLVSDADGAIVAVAAALTLADMCRAGDQLVGTVRIHTHICPAAQTKPAHPVPMMRSPLGSRQMMAHEVHDDMAAILSVDATKATRLVNRRGVALTPVVKEGWILPLPAEVLDVLSWVSGELPVVVPLTTQDLTPLDNGLRHINSMMQPCTVSTSPVIGVALTAMSTVPGCATGVTNPVDLDVAVRFCIEVAKRFGARALHLFDESELNALTERYGPMRHLQTMGANSN